MEGSWDRSASKEMTPAEIERVVALFVRIGVRHLKITGGEPTLRPDLVEIVRRTAPLVEEVSMTTNGIRLDGLANELRGAGLRRVNISLDTLDPASFKRITSYPLQDLVMRGIRSAHDAGLSPIKLNMVVLKGENSDRIWDMVRYARENDLVLQLIELHAPRDIVDDEMFRSMYFSLEGIERELERSSDRVELARMHKRRRFHLKDGGIVEIVRPQFNNDFCTNCHRIRVQADGRIRPCLLSRDGLVDILTPMRSGASDETIITIIGHAIKSRVPYWNQEDNIGRRC